MSRQRRRKSEHRFRVGNLGLDPQIVALPFVLFGHLDALETQQHVPRPVKVGRIGALTGKRQHLAVSHTGLHLDVQLFLGFQQFLALAAATHLHRTLPVAPADVAVHLRLRNHTGPDLPHRHPNALAATRTTRLRFFRPAPVARLALAGLIKLELDVAALVEIGESYADFVDFVGAYGRPTLGSSSASKHSVQHIAHTEMDLGDAKRPAHKGKGNAAGRHTGHRIRRPSVDGTRDIIVAATPRVRQGFVGFLNLFELFLVARGTVRVVLETQGLVGTADFVGRRRPGHAQRLVQIRRHSFVQSGSFV